AASPGGRLLEWARAEGVAPIEIEFEDPHEGAGGFGASSAQFALLYRALAERAGLEPSAPAAWRRYRQLTAVGAGEGLAPSGADLVAQWLGGICDFDPAAGSGE